MAISKLNTLVLEIASGLRAVVPQAILAEVVPQQTMASVASSTPWLLGFLDWRGEQVAVVDPGVICGREAPAVEGIHRYGVLYALEQIVGLSYYAVPLAGIPHPVRVGPDEIEADASADAGCPALASMARIEGQAVAIPDFSHLERLLEEQLLRL